MRPRSSSASAVLVATLVTLTLAGCAGDEDVVGEGPVTVYVSLPMRGASGADGQDAADGARLALSEAGGESGGREVRAVFLDDTEGTRQRARWTPEQAAANARQATEDSTAIAYIGDFESGATRSSLPITNDARLLQVSPASAAVDLVAPFPGSDDVPDAQSSGERTFGRVIPSDEAQGRAAAGWVEELGWRRVGVVATQPASDFADVVGEAFEQQGRDLGLVVREEAELLARPRGLDSHFVAGEGKVLIALAGTTPDALSGQRLLITDALLDQLSPGASGADLYATSAALDPSQLPPAGQELVDSFRAEYGRAPGRYAAYGYEAMAVVLDSIERAGEGETDREAVVDAFFDTEERDSVLGTYSIDEVGDTSLDRLTGYRVADREARPIAELTVP